MDFIVAKFPNIEHAVQSWDPCGFSAWGNLGVFRVFFSKMPYRRYTPKQLEEALLKIRNKQMTLNEASRNYPISSGTLSNHLNGNHTKKVGRPYELSAHIENELVMVLQYLADIGFGMSTTQFRMMIKEMLDADGQVSSRFKENLPTKKFVTGFLKRHPEISIRRPLALPKNRAEAMSEVQIRGFFKETYGKALITSGIGVQVNGTISVIKPHCLWNCDESSIQLTSSMALILAKTGKKTIHKVNHSNHRTNYTILGCANAMAHVLPPHLLFPGERLGKNWINGGAQGATYGMSGSGWMEKPHFTKWFRDVFIPAAKKIDSGAHILVVDGHVSHIGYDLIAFARANDIHLVLLPPHSTHILQPFDVGIFGPMKAEWSKVLEGFNLREKRVCVEKYHMASLLKELWERALKPQHVLMGFRRSGLCPFNPEETVKEAKDIGDVHAPPSSSADSSSCSGKSSSSGSSSSESDTEGDQDQASTSGVAAASACQPSTSSVSSAVIKFFRKVVAGGKANRGRGRGRGRGGFVQSRRYGEILTEDEVAARIQEEEEERRQKRRKKGEKKCDHCGKKWEAKKRVATWGQCDDCNRWYCDRCLPHDFDPNLPFSCDNCD